MSKLVIGIVVIAVILAIFVFASRDSPDLAPKNSVKNIDALDEGISAESLGKSSGGSTSGLTTNGTNSSVNATSVPTNYCTTPVLVGLNSGGGGDIENNFIAYYLSLPPYGIKGVYSGNDSKFGTADDVNVNLTTPAPGFLQHRIRVEGKNIVWLESNNTYDSVKLLNNGPDNTFGTADDIGPITVFSTFGSLTSSYFPADSGPYIRKNLVSFVETLGTVKNVYWCATDKLKASCFVGNVTRHNLASVPTTQTAIGYGDSNKQVFVWDKTGGITNGDVYYNDNSNFSAIYIVENTTDDEMLRDFDGTNVLFQHVNVNTVPRWLVSLNLGKIGTPNTRIPISPQYTFASGISIFSAVLSDIPYNGKNLATWRNIGGGINELFVGGVNMASIRIQTILNNSGGQPRVYGNKVLLDDSSSLSSYGKYYSECNV